MKPVVRILEEVQDLAAATHALADVVTQLLRQHPEPFPHAALVADNVRWDAQEIRNRLEKIALEMPDA